MRLLDIRKQAKQDYEQARGTAHKRLLQKARRSLVQKQRQNQKNLSQTQTNQQNIRQQLQASLEQALVDHVVQTRLQEIPTIGQQRKQAILQSVYRGKLTDLHQAQHLPGIGAQSQQAINVWVRQVQKELPRLFQQDFPRKQAIVANFEPKWQDLSRAIQQYEQLDQKLQARLDRIDRELSWLERVNEKSFRQALRDEAPSQAIGRYIQGVFAEWEPVPDWFRDIIQLAGETASGRTHPTTKAKAKKAPNGAADRAQTEKRSQSGWQTKSMTEKFFMALIVATLAVSICFVLFIVLIIFV